MNSFAISKSLQAACGLCVVVVLSGLESRAATRTWDGGGANSNWTTATNWVGDLAPVPGDDLIFPTGAARLANTNDFASGAGINSITFTGGGYTLYGANLVLFGGINGLHGTGLNQVRVLIQLGADQTFTNIAGGGLYFQLQTIDFNGWNLTFGAVGEIQTGLSIVTGGGTLIKTGIGQLETGSLAINFYTGVTEVREGTLLIQGGSALGTTNGNTIIFPGATLSVGTTFISAESLEVRGALRFGSAAVGVTTWTGPFSFQATNVSANVFGNSRANFNGPISGTGGLTKSGTGTLTLNATNTYTGSTTNSDGLLLINGFQPQSPIAITGGTLGGTGTVGTITAGGGSSKTIAPGGSPGILSSSNVTLNSTTAFRVELNGTSPGSGYDQLNVTGGVTLSNATLNATLSFPSAISNAFTIIQNDGTDAVTSTFNGLAEGAITNFSGTPFRITYVGGTGNDVVLTQLAPTPQPTLSIRPLPPTNVVISWATNFIGYTLEANTNLNTNVWAVVSPAPTVSGTNRVVTNGISGLGKHYRLRAP